MVFKELEPIIMKELGLELEKLAKDYMKDITNDFADATRRYENLKSAHEMVLNTEITEKFLKSKGYSLSSNNPAYK